MTRWFCALMIGISMAVSVRAGAADFVAVDDHPLQLDASKGALLRLDRPAATVFVANPEVADVQVKSPRLVYVMAKAPGETTLYAVDKNERVILGRRISVNHNLKRLKESIHRLVPDADIDVSSVDGALVLSGEADSVAEAEDAKRLADKLVKNPEKDIINKIAVNGPNQIQLRVRIAEVSKDLLKQFGINWETLANTGNWTFGIATGRDVVNGSNSIQRSGDLGSIYGNFSNGSADVNGLIDALNQEGLVSILAEPNLTTVSGERSEMLAGGEFPILVPGKDNQVTVSFKPFGVLLVMLPTLVGPNRINLHVVPEVSELTSAGAVQIKGYSVPALSTRRVRTTVELGSGQSFAIAGLIRNISNKTIQEFPGLGQLPILGPLFRSEKFQRNETELVVIVTPYIVRPISDRHLALPTDGLIPPNDIDRIIRGYNYRRNLQPTMGGVRSASGNRLAGPAGFQLN